MFLEISLVFIYFIRNFMLCNMELKHKVRNVRRLDFRFYKDNRKSKF